MKKQYLYTLIVLFILSVHTLSSQDYMGVDFNPDQRIALIIGNSEYDLGYLANPVNDARAMSKALTEAGFEVIKKENVSNVYEMKKVVREFGDKIQNGGVGLFYFAGHGIQVKDKNFLVPVNAVINHEEEVEYEALDLGFVMAQMEYARNGMNIIILDACRNNPFARSFRSSSNGLASVNAPTGTLIAYATAPNMVASDGAGDNGLYTEELLKNIALEGLKIEEVFKNVRAAVLEKSGGQQVPWESSSLIGDFYFREPAENELTDIPDNTETTDLELLGTKYKDSQERILTDVTDVNDVIYQGAKNVASLARDVEWKAKDNLYWLYINDEQVAKQTVNSNAGDDLIVYHSNTNRTFLLKDFYDRQDETMRPAIELKSESAAVWRSEDLFYKIYYKGVSVAKETENSKIGDDLLVYHPGTRTTFVLPDFYEYQDNSYRNAEIIYSMDNAFFRSEESSYWLYVNADNIAKETRNNWFGDHLQAYHDKTRTLYFFEEYKNRKDGKIHEAMVQYAPGRVTWSGKNKSYWIYFDGRPVNSTFVNTYSEDDLLVYDKDKNLTYILRDFEKNLDGEEREVDFIYSPDNAFFRRQKNTYWLYVKGELISPDTTNEFDGDDLKVEHTPTGDTYRLPNYKDAKDNKLRSAELD